MSGGQVNLPYFDCLLDRLHQGDADVTEAFSRYVNWGYWDEPGQNDGSLRDYQRQHSVAVGKNFVATGGFGPWLVTRDEIPDPSQLTLTTRLDGAEVQRGDTADMIFSVPHIISYVSAFTQLDPGDVISTGTPPGVGMARKPPLWLKPGDVVEVEISKIGVLRNSVVAESK